MDTVEHEISLNISPSENWVPLLEFAHRKGVSLSTLRRYIKSQKIQFKLERGRYFILDSDSANSTKSRTVTNDDTARLQTELHQARKEIAELKMLVAFYEDKQPDGSNA